MVKKVNQLINIQVNNTVNVFDNNWKAKTKFKSVAIYIELICNSKYILKENLWPDFIFS